MKRARPRRDVADETRAAYDRGVEKDLTQDPEAQGDEPSRYAKLPAQVRREDMRTSQDVRRHPDEKGEHDRETDWMLRTTGLFI